MESSPPVLITPHGDVLLDVHFRTSSATLRAAKKASASRPTQPPPAAPQQPLKAAFTKTYRVSSASLCSHSAYFDRLLSDTRFAEARTVRTALDALTSRGIKPSDAKPEDLPKVRIEDDDDASKAAGREREAAFAEMLRILHGGDAPKVAAAKWGKDGKPVHPAKKVQSEQVDEGAYRWTPTRPPSLLELATLAILADRFACVKPVSAYVRVLKFRFPQAQVRARSAENPAVLVNEEAIRQKILIGWLVDQPLKFQSGTRELIIHGSKRWSPLLDPDEVDTDIASWWDLPDDLEQELQHRRACILSCIASIQGHFLRLYTSRERQCKLGYGSSPACDSFQLGEMVRFLTNKELLVLGDFSSPFPMGAEQSTGRDWSTVDVNHLLLTLKQCPSYQVDNNHTNCGLRTRILPIVEYVQSMLSSNVVAIARPAWHSNREGATWVMEEQEDRLGDEKEGVFSFTRGLSGDQRLRFEGAMAADAMARRLFTARKWDWTPDD